MRLGLSPRMEMRLYERLGVKVFQKMAFLLEKLVHIKDKDKNTNYHFRRLDVEAIEAFVKYLFYNGSIHARNLVYFAIYVLIFLIFRSRVRWFDVLVLILAIKDAYCVMLQRYNYLRISELKKLAEQRRERRINQKVKQLKEGFERAYDAQYTQEDLAFVQEMKQKIANGENIVIGEKEKAILERLADALHKNDASHMEA